ncbi:putative sperm motility kinase W [Rattus norvegicus]|uniref:non-specific serine/threonine protein kinase n=1 Tax=Rattus norvegicus TaxID=10116 RepID=M0R777_RAT|nr:putative sperm motility kinase W [Rattus norvegicus]XP_038936416.1 putative sperm motility kinase W [Rattus norvegicus]XP_038936417.1 putative sperm motility kinase W [Rattus norvegicus]XP_038936418.1 putative sperm motility kinase W [Rattus norvegicus]XP_038936419.1 putative sperm motility kinase W [Rattus norvegicus]|eukprot:XP_006241199.1 PREDICTED: putative sperm motility kinase W [Rattus norvegicus]
MASKSKEKTLGSHYKILSYLGQGSFGTVNLAWHLKTQALVAIKMLEISKETISSILSERAILETLHHPNIIRLFQVLITSSHVNFVLEYAPGGSLFELIKEGGPLQEEVAKKIFGQTVSAVKYCHNLDIVHRDIKPQNILTDAEGNGKLTDFGLATKFRPGTLLKELCGTKEFYAPELVLREPYNGKKTDVWSLGVLLYFISTGYCPFRGVTTKDMEKKIATGTYTIPTYFSGQLENLIHQILTVSPEMRPSIEDIEKHPWVRKCEVNIPTITCPDYKIVEMLCGMGYNANKILESLQKKKYDEPMAAYLILKDKVRQEIEHGTTTSDMPVDQGPLPPQSPAHHSVSGLPLKRRASEPNFGLLHIWPPGEQVARHNVARSVSMPPIALYGTKKQNSTSTSALHSRPVASPCVCNTILEIEIPLPTKQDFDMKTSSPPQRIGYFQRLCQRIRDCLSRLCCFLWAPKVHSPRKWLP